MGGVKLLGGLKGSRVLRREISLTYPVEEEGWLLTGLEMGDFFRSGFENKLRNIFVTGLDALKLGGGVVRVFQGVQNRGLVSVNRACFVFVSWVLARNGLVYVLDVRRFGHLWVITERVDNGL